MTTTAAALSIENDWLLLENGVDNLLLEDATTPLLLETAPAMLDLTAYLDQGSLQLKVNTADLSLTNPPANAVHLGEALALTNPAWSGSVVAVETADVTGKIGDVRWAVTAINTNALPTDTAPFDLSESPTDGTFNYLLEDGSGIYLLEDGTDFAPGAYLTEGPLSYGYRNLKVKKQQNSDGSYTTIGSCEVWQPGLRPGDIFLLTSTNRGYVAAPFQITQAGITWPGKAGDPKYAIEFGDTPFTLAQWAAILAPSQPVPVSSPSIVPTGITIYGKCSAGHKLWPAGGGIVTIASATFSVSAPAGHTQTVQLVGQIDCRAYAWDNFIATPRRAVRAVISGGIYTGAWQETPAGTATTAGARATYDLSSAPSIALPDGTYTVSVQIDTQEANQMEVFSAYAQAAVTVV